MCSNNKGKASTWEVENITLIPCGPSFPGMPDMPWKEQQSKTNLPKPLFNNKHVRKFRPMLKRLIKEFCTQLEKYWKLMYALYLIYSRPTARVMFRTLKGFSLASDEANMHGMSGLITYETFPFWHLQALSAKKLIVLTECWYIQHNNIGTSSTGYNYRSANLHNLQKTCCYYY